MTKRSGGGSAAIREAMGGQQSTGREAVQRVLLLHLAVSGLCLLPVGLGSTPFLPLSVALSLAELLPLLATAWIVLSWAFLVGTVFDAYVLLVLSAALCHFGQTTLHLFGYLPEGLFDQKVPPTAVISALYLSTGSLLAFHLGALLCVWLLDGRRSAPGVFRRWQPTPAKMRQVAWFITLFVLPAFLLSAQRLLTLSVTGGYRALFHAGPKSYGFAKLPEVVGRLIIPAALMLVAAHRTRTEREVGRAVILGNALMWFIVGHRSSAIGPLVALTWLWDRRVKRVPRLPAVLIAILMFVVVFPAVAVLRGYTGEDKLSARSGARLVRILSDPVTATFSELGNILQIVALTTECVPKFIPHDYGATYLRAGLAVLPNLFWAKHPVAAVEPYGHFLTRRYFPDFYIGGGGIGRSIIAEAYINFGWLGAMLFFVLVGCLFTRFVLWAELSRSPAACAILASWLCFGLLAPRGSAVDLVRPLIWYGLSPYLLAVAWTRAGRLNEPATGRAPEVGDQRPEGGQDRDAE